jgi:hypothetical protein
MIIGTGQRFLRKPRSFQRKLAKDGMFGVSALAPFEPLLELALAFKRFLLRHSKQSLHPGFREI